MSKPTIISHYDIFIIKEKLIKLQADVDKEMRRSFSAGKHRPDGAGYERCIDRINIQFDNFDMFIDSLHEDRVIGKKMPKLLS